MHRQTHIIYLILLECHRVYYTSIIIYYIERFFYSETYGVIKLFFRTLIFMKTTQIFFCFKT